MNIYHYHPVSGAYLGSGMADESPLEPGVWLIPAHATKVAPPVFGEGEQAVFDGSAWAVLPIIAAAGNAAADPTMDRRSQILVALQQIDSASIRPSRAIALAAVTGGTASASDIERLQQLEAQAQALRDELAALEAA